ncbi:MAG: DUF3127 domain-containing protein [Bacteroidia bacterium]|jgi:hypothetical protein|nr:DUF3127 domain-containing protein [Bacteroidia bacterium]MDG2041418.1 DUF3127 domain-containing protein [Bacteroidia bacterium]|tara:strand:- start:371 stop:739 length:369 start_codon:yes stop_codon:yes gene_type:complete
MDSIVIEGRLIQVLTAQEGQSTRGAWKKQDFVIETSEQYPKKVCISCWNEKTDELSKFQLNDNLKVSVNIESREYNSKWYTDVKAWRIDQLNDSAPVSNNSKANDDVSGVSFTSDENDDLPF